MAVWLRTWGSPQVLEAAHGLIAMVFSDMASRFVKPARRVSSLRQNLIQCNKIPLPILSVRSKSQVSCASKGRTKTNRGKVMNPKGGSHWGSCWGLWHGMMGGIRWTDKMPCREWTVVPYGCNRTEKLGKRDSGWGSNNHCQHSHNTYSVPECFYIC